MTRRLFSGLLSCVRSPGGSDDETQHRAVSHHAYRQPAAAGRSHPHDVRQGGGRAGRSGGARRARARRRWPRWSTKQVEAGIDIVNDGEMSKPSYATYVKDRLAGFGGTGNTFVYQDLADFPALAKRVFGDPGRSRRKTPACNAPIAVRDPAAAKDDAANLKAALARAPATEAFMSAASPGVDLAVLPQRLLPEPGGLSVRHRRRDAARIRDGRGRRLRAADRLSRPRHGPAHPVRRPEPRRNSASAPRMHIEALNHALRQHPAGAAAHAPVLGQLRRPAPLRRAARRHHRRRVQGAAAGDLVRGRQSAPRPRVDAVRDA